MKLLLAAALITAVFVSGCVTNNQQSTGGITILNFEPDIKEAFSGEVVTFLLRMQNTGSKTAKNVHAELLGIDQDWFSETKRGPPVGKGPWINKEKLPEEEVCRYNSQGFNLLPPDPSSGTPGDFFVCTWKYIAPELPKTFSVTYTPTARVYYEYESTAVQEITILPKSELVRLQNEGKPLPSTTKSISISPVILDIQVPTPIRTTQTQVEFPVKITIKNAQQGTACFSESLNVMDCKHQNTNWNKVKLILESKSATLYDCDNEMTIDLIKAKTNTITCTLSVELQDTQQGLSEKTITFTARAKYIYMIDSQTSITVFGSRTL